MLTKLKSTPLVRRVAAVLSIKDTPAMKKASPPAPVITPGHIAATVAVGHGPDGNAVLLSMDSSGVLLGELGSGFGLIPAQSGNIRHEVLLGVDSNGNFHALQMDVDGSLKVSGAGGTGGVSSVGLTVPARQTVTGSPVIAAGTLAVSDNAQLAGTVFAGPSSGGPAVPGFRFLSPSDVFPQLAGHAGAVLQTDGNNVSWQMLDGGTY